MVEQADIENINKVEIPVDTKENVPEVDDTESGINDVAYFEDYLDNKYDKLVKMAQAYSDYGVLDGKKDPGNEKEEKVTERRVKLSVDKRRYKKGIFGRFTKGPHKKKPNVQRENSPEEIPVELSPTNDVRVNAFHSKQLPNSVYKHINKLSDKSNSLNYAQTTATYLPALKKEDAQISDLFNSRHEKGDDFLGKSSVILLKTNKNKPKKKHNFVHKSTKIYDTNRVHENERYLVRSLKSVMYDEDFFFNDNASPTKINNKNNSTNVTMLVRNNEDSNNSYINTDISLQGTNQKNEVKITPVNITEGNPGVDISEFFKMISKWFSTLASISVEDNKTNSDLSSQIMKLTINTNDPIINNDLSRQQSAQNSTEAIYPMYDADMIENIAHRSRVLMSIDDINSTKISTEINNVYVNENDVLYNISDTVKQKRENFSTVTQNAVETLSLKIQKPRESQIETDVNKNISESKTIVKRSLGDSGLIFWNDIYDDEYGLNIDPLDNTIEDKRSNKGNDFMKKSGMWIQDKVRKITDNYFRGPKEKKKNKKRNSRSIKSFRADMYPKGTFKYNLHRKPRFLKEDDSNEKSTNFADLTTKMRGVCKEAAKTIQDSKIIKVRHNNKEETIATSLMQQLVHLMTDLVNFQVQQMTCLALPPDLHDFLEWLTSPNPTRYDHSDDEETSNPNENEKSTDDNMELVKMRSKEEVYPGSRTEYLGTLHSVQDLIQQYNDMNDEDKSKMTGVKDYLENQLDFLNKQIAFSDEYSFSTLYPNQGRFRRHVTSRRQRKYLKNKLKRSLKTKFKKFINYFGRNRTRTTHGYHEGSRSTKDKKNKKINVKIANYEESKVKQEKAKGNSNLDQNMKGDTNTLKDMKSGNAVLDKRNLHDVYYKAVADAKKIVTDKNDIKKGNG